MRFDDSVAFARELFELCIAEFARLLGRCEVDVDEVFLVVVLEDLDNAADDLEDNV